MTTTTQNPYPADGISRGARAIQNADRRVARYQNEVRKLRQQNAALLAALRVISEINLTELGAEHAKLIARAAIAKAEQP